MADDGDDCGDDDCDDGVMVYLVSFAPKEQTNIASILSSAIYIYNIQSQTV